MSLLTFKAFCLFIACPPPEFHFFYVEINSDRITRKIFDRLIWEGFRENFAWLQCHTWWSWLRPNVRTAFWCVSKTFNKNKRIIQITLWFETWKIKKQFIINFHRMIAYKSNGRKVWIYQFNNRIRCAK